MNAIKIQIEQNVVSFSYYLVLFLGLVTGNHIVNAFIYLISIGLRIEGMITVSICKENMVTVNPTLQHKLILINNSDLKAVMI